MLVIQRDTREQLLIGPSSTVECLGLFFCGTAAIAITLPLISLALKMDFTLPGPILLQLAQYPIGFGAMGLFMIFSQRRVLFHHARREVHVLQGPRTASTWRYDDIASVELQSSANPQGMLSLIMSNGTRILITRGPTEKLPALAARIDTVIKAGAVPSAQPEGLL